MLREADAHAASFLAHLALGQLMQMPLHLSVSAQQDPHSPPGPAPTDTRPPEAPAGFLGPESGRAEESQKFTWVGPWEGGFKNTKKERGVGTQLT
jgi:hypothetical protein